MMEPVHRVSSSDASAIDGSVEIDWTKVFWTGGMLAFGLISAFWFTTWSAVLIGLALTYVTLLFGHSVGMHRMMIHRSFKAVPWLRYILLYSGTLVGIGGPTAVIRIHDIRDWAQREPNCHAFFSHNRRYLSDILWQLFYRFEFKRPPTVSIESEISDNGFIQHLDKYWKLHQFGFAGLLLLIGGLPFVVWGVFIRVSVSTIGHWSITHFCHNPGPGRWIVTTSGVQASNLKLPGWFGGWITHGECWHNNHHAFPESARIGLYPNQIDPAGWIIEKLEAIGLVHDVRHPRTEIEDLTLRSCPSSQVQ